MIELFRDHPGRIFLLATLLPLAASAIGLILASLRGMVDRKFGSRIPDSVAYLVLLSMLAAAACSVTGLTWRITDDTPWQEQCEWIKLGPWRDHPALHLGYNIDKFAALMVTMVTVIGSLIVLFSLGYMKEETKATVEDHSLHLKRRGRHGRFFVYLGLFCFSMLNLLIADNLLQVFISWELVGVCSYFLISFYTERPSATNAANKAFIVNRVGDAGFLVALFLLYAHMRDFNIAAFSNPEPWQWWFGLCLFIGCMGKSAQVPLQTWLPDAMEGPTPVSALIHAATMVAAGVYLVGRCYVMMADVMMTIAVIGAVTAFISATIAVVQTDIKRVLAFSTCSQLGLMMTALGIGAWTAGLFHLLTHAFFKALLFLGAGSVIHGTHHEQDLRKFGGLRKAMPITAYTMLIGVLAIAGIPFLSGWASKDLIVSHLFALGQTRFGEPVVAVIVSLCFMTVFLTAFYMLRLWLMTFAGTPRDSKLHAHESPMVMTLPLAILAAFSICVGWGSPVWDAEAGFMVKILKSSQPKPSALDDDAHHAHTMAGLIALGLASLGIVVAIVCHLRGVFLRESNSTGLRRFLDARWYFDAIYDVILVKPTVWLSRMFAVTDKSQNDVGTPGVRYDLHSLDGVLAAPATWVRSLGGGLSEANKGLPRSYVLAMALTVVAALAILSRYVR